MTNTFQWPWAEIQPACRPPLMHGPCSGLVRSWVAQPTYWARPASQSDPIGLEPDLNPLSYPLT
jgi:hypothetical protein